MYYILYKSDGTHEVLERAEKIEYEELSKLVGGMIEFSENFEGFSGSTLMMNEEGLLNGMKPNPFFTPRYQEYFAGDIVEGEMNDDGEFIGFKELPTIREPKTINPKLFEKDKVFTIISIGDFFAQTTRNSVKSTGAKYNELPVFKENKKGARKIFSLRNIKGKDTLIFEGTDLPFKVDGEVKKVNSNGFTSSTIRGNALLNFVGDPDTIREWVKTKNLNPFFTAYDRVNHISDDNETETLLFMDRFASCQMVADKQEAQLKREGKNVKVGVGYQISSGK